MSAAQCDHVGKLRRVCEVCGAPVQHPPRGRPRRYCGEGCARSRHNERKRDERREFITYKTARARLEAEGLVTP